MIRQYRICNLNITVDAPFFYEDSALWRLFSADFGDCADIYYHVNYVDKLDNSAESDGQFYRVFNMGTQPGYSFAFDNKNCRDVFVRVLNSCANVLMDSRFMWDTLRLCDILLYHNALVVHSALIDTQHGGIAFCAPSGVGKSTQAALWAKYRNAQIINGDKSAFVYGENGISFCSVPFCGTSGIDINKNAAALAAVFLNQSSENNVQMPAAAEIFSLLSRDIIADTSVPEFGRRAVELMLNIIGKLRFYTFGCTPDENAVDALECALFKEANGVERL